MSLKQVKNKIISTKKTGQVTKAMESVSAVKMRKSQERAFTGRPYVHAAMRILSRISASPELDNSNFTTKRETGKRLLVIVTSDKGLAGSVNSSVIKMAEQVIEKYRAEIEIICIGKKAVDFASREKLTMIEEHTNVGDDVTIDDVYKMSSTVIEKFNSGDYKEIEVIYQNFLSTFEQVPTKRTILPLDPAEVHYIMRGIRPKTGKFSDEVEDAVKRTAYIVEPSVEEVLESLIPRLVQIILYHSLLESKASEHSSRMVAMKNATDKSKEVIKALTIKYNKARQSAITAEVSEITAGVEAMK